MYRRGEIVRFRCVRIDFTFFCAFDGIFLSRWNAVNGHWAHVCTANYFYFLDLFRWYKILIRL